MSAVSNEFVSIWAAIQSMDHKLARLVLLAERADLRESKPEDRLDRIGPPIHEMDVTLDDDDPEAQRNPV